MMQVHNARPQGKCLPSFIPFDQSGILATDYTSVIVGLHKASVGGNQPSGKMPELRWTTML
jgi:hypothetical protein